MGGCASTPAEAHAPVQQQPRPAQALAAPTVQPMPTTTSPPVTVQNGKAVMQVDPGTGKVLPPWIVTAQETRQGDSNGSNVISNVMTNHTAAAEAVRVNLLEVRRFGLCRKPTDSTCMLLIVSLTPRLETTRTLQWHRPSTWC